MCAQPTYMLASLQQSFAPVDVAVIVLLISLPLQIAGQTIVAVGAYRTDHIPSNRFHRVFAFCDRTLVGKALLWLSLCSTAIFIFVAVLWASSGNVVEALYYSIFPGVFFPILAVVELKIERRYPSSE